MKKQVAPLVEAELRRAAKSDAQESNEEQYIISMVEAAVTKTLNQKNELKSQAKPNNRILSKDQILVSCSHMTCYLLLQNLHYISIYIFY